MSSEGRNLIRALSPLAVHLGISFIVTVIFDMIAGSLGTAGTDAGARISAVALCSLPVLWRMWKRDRESRPMTVRSRRTRTWLEQVGFYGAAFAGGILLSCAGSFLLRQSGIAGHFSNRAQEELFAAHPAVLLVGLCLLVPLAEELLYRGLFYGRLREFLPRRPAVLCAAVIFAVAHGNMIQALYALPMALVMHWLYETDGCLLAPIAFHMGANLIAVLIERLI